MSSIKRGSLDTWIDLQDISIDKRVEDAKSWIYMQVHSRSWTNLPAHFESLYFPTFCRVSLNNSVKSICLNCF